jgi:hypothetical protein
MHVSRIRIGALLLLTTTIAVAQRIPPVPAQPNIAEPKLPVIDYDACPGKGRVVPDWKISHDSPMYSSWEDNRRQAGSLKVGEKVAVLSGVSITRNPDRILVTRPKPDLSLIPGDIILRYETFGEGAANIWAKGALHEKYDLWTTVETDGAGCRAKDVCDSRVFENGIKEWWVQVKTNAGQTGWVLSRKVTRGAFWDSRNFDNLCAG